MPWSKATTEFPAPTRLSDPEVLGHFAAEFLRCEARWEFLWPDTRLRDFEDDYKWLAKVYASVQPATPSNALLWHRLGAKTAELVHTAITDVTVDRTGLEAVVMDDEVIRVIRQLSLPGTKPDEDEEMTVEEALDTIEARLRRKLQDPDPHSVWVKLSKRLEALRRAKLQQAEESVEFLKNLLEIARQVLEAEKAEDDGTLDDYDSVLPDPNIGALTKIFEEYAPDATPEIIERVVHDIDAIVEQVRFSGWQTSQPGDRKVRQEIRVTLKKYGLPATGQLFDRAYGYVRENY